MSRARGKQWNSLRGGGRNNPFAETHWTRQEAADYLRVAKSTIIAWEKTGVLKFLVDDWGQRWFEPAEVRRIPVSRSPGRRAFPESKEGKLEATIFQMFQDGVSFAEIVTKLQVPTKKVRALYTQYTHELDDVLPTPPTAAAKVKAAKLAVVKSEKELEAVKVAERRREHELRLAREKKEEEEEARFRAKKAKLGTLNLKPEGEPHE